MKQIHFVASQIYLIVTWFENLINVVIMKLQNSQPWHKSITLNLELTYTTFLYVFVQSLIINFLFQRFVAMHKHNFLTLEYREGSLLLIEKSIKLQFLKIGFNRPETKTFNLLQLMQICFRQTIKVVCRKEKQVILSFGRKTNNGIISFECTSARIKTPDQNQIYRQNIEIMFRYQQYFFLSDLSK